MEQNNQSQTNAQPVGVEILSIEQVLALEQKIRENKAAQLRGDPLPHEVTAEEIAKAIASVRHGRGVVTPAKSGKASSGGKAKIELLDLDGL